MRITGRRPPDDCQHDEEFIVAWLIHLVHRAWQQAPWLLLTERQATEQVLTLLMELHFQNMANPDSISAAQMR